MKQIKQKILKLFFTGLILSMTSIFGHSQENVECNVILSNWETADCDKTYDPYKLKNRITEIELKDNHTIITVNFSDNCCVELKPEINFENNKLVLLPYLDYEGDYCDCDCCFSIRYDILGLLDSNYETYFKNSKIEFSIEHYAVIEPTFELYQGEKINKTNKYGFRVGQWLYFYENGNIKNISRFPDNELYYESYPNWTKGYYETGELAYYQRKDTTESWFKNGEPKSWFFEYTIGDTTFKEGYALFDNHQLSKKFKEKHFNTIRKSEFDLEYQFSGADYEVIYNELYYENKKPKLLFTKDTTFSWYENGNIKSKNYKSGELEYNENGILTQKTFKWKTLGTKKWGDLNNSLYVDYFPNGQIKVIELVRDEPVDGGIAPSVRYEWTWNSKCELIKAPIKWDEELPWKRFDELKTTANPL